MYPTLLYIGRFRIDTYSVMWFIALSCAIIWSIKRLRLYEIDEDEARKIMAISFIFMLIGARLPEIFRNIKIYMHSPSLLLDLNRGGLEEFGAVLGAFVSALILCAFSKKVSFLKLCEVAAPPAMLSIAIGRWGCFLNGCCVGNTSNFFMAVHFPHDAPGITRHPVQIYYSVIAAVIVWILLKVERKVLPRQKYEFHSVIAPLALILYSLMRISVSFVREALPLQELVSRHWTYMAIMLAFPVECLWFAWSLRRTKADG